MPLKATRQSSRFGGQRILNGVPNTPHYGAEFAAPLGMLRYTPEQMREMGPTGAARHIAAGVEDTIGRLAAYERAGADVLYAPGLRDGAEISARSVVLATGASYQRLAVPSIEALVGAGVFYGGGITEAPAMIGQQVYVVGAGAGGALQYFERFRVS